MIVSCFDPIRREVARRSLEALIQDGRIHPGADRGGRAEAQKELESQLVEVGEQAALDAGIHGLAPRLIKLIGRMKYRTSYGQNILEHSKEVAWLAGMMAAELRLDAAARRVAACCTTRQGRSTHEKEGTHVELGVEVARRYGESGAGDELHRGPPRRRPARDAESVMVQAADAISGAVPGPVARRSRPTSSASRGWRRSPTGFRAWRRAMSFRPDGKSAWS